MNKYIGFTLVELMVVVAIVGILAGIAYPSYQLSILKSRRADAQGQLLGLVNSMERYFTETNTYVGAPEDHDTDYYALTIQSATVTGYTLRATPTGHQASDSCGNLEITHTGAKTAATTGCW